MTSPRRDLNAHATDSGNGWTPIEEIGNPTGNADRRNQKDSFRWNQKGPMGENTEKEAIEPLRSPVFDD